MAGSEAATITKGGTRAREVRRPPDPPAPRSPAPTGAAHRSCWCGYRQSRTGTNVSFVVRVPTQVRVPTRRSRFLRAARPRPDPAGTAHRSCMCGYR